MVILDTSFSGANGKYNGKCQYRMPELLRAREACYLIARMLASNHNRHGL